MVLGLIHFSRPLLPFWPCKTASKRRMWRYVADMGIMLRYVINGIELGQSLKRKASQRARARGWGCYHPVVACAPTTLQSVHVGLRSGAPGSPGPAPPASWINGVECSDYGDCRRLPRSRRR